MKVSDYSLSTVLDNLPRTVEGKGFIDYIAFYRDATRNGLYMVVNRAYDQAKAEIGAQVEKLDIAERAPWVRLRAAMRGMQL